MSQPYAAELLPQERLHRRLPVKMLVLTAFYFLVVTVGIVCISDVEDLLGIGLDMVLLFALFGTPILMLLWIGWFLFFSRWRWPIRIGACCLLIAFPTVFLKVFRPVNGGDATIARFEPIWAQHSEVSTDGIETSDGTVDLMTETPDDFPGFLGTERSGVVTSGIQIDVDRFTNAEPVWKQPIGRGWSGFAARNGFAVTMEQREDQECVTCYEVLTGKLRWIYQHQTRHRDAMNLGRTGPRSTPTISDGLVYAVGAVGNFACLNGNDGTVVWQVDLNEILNLKLNTVEGADGYNVQHEASSTLAWGRSGSPLVMDELVVVPGGGPTAGPISTLLAFDRSDGRLVWRGGTEMIAYGSPVLTHVAGRDQILLTAETKSMGFDPATGQVLWEVPRPGESNGGANTSQVTAVSANEVLTTKGYPDGYGELIRLSNRGGKIIPDSVWQNPRAFKTKLTSPVIHDGYAYSISNGFLECARLSDGKRNWKRRGRFGHGQMLLIGEDLLVHSETGVLFLVRATPNGYEEHGSFPTIEGVCWNTLCLYGNRLLVRSELEAACFELPVRK